MSTKAVVKWNNIPRYTIIFTLPVNPQISEFRMWNRNKINSIRKQKVRRGPAEPKVQRPLPISHIGTTIWLFIRRQSHLFYWSHTRGNAPDEISSPGWPRTVEAVQKSDLHTFHAEIESTLARARRTSLSSLRSHWLQLHFREGKWQAEADWSKTESSVR